VVQDTQMLARLLGGDEAAVAHKCTPLEDSLLSSPPIALFQAGTPVHLIDRHGIERHDASQIAAPLTEAFGRSYGPAAPLT